MLKFIDIPPVWLAAFAALGWALAADGPVILGSDRWGDTVGAAFVAFGLVLIGLAAWQFRKHQTTVIPHLEASNLVTTGVFSWSRNPIYLADSFILVGLFLRWDALLALALVPVFILLIQYRFILPEEMRLERKFRAKFDAYKQQTRRWL